MQTSEQEMHKKELGAKGASKEDIKGLSEEILYKIDIPANRYDMLCLEGIARALNIFNHRINRVDYKLANMAGQSPSPDSPTQLRHCLHSNVHELGHPCAPCTCPTFLSTRL